MYDYCFQDIIDVLSFVPILSSFWFGQANFGCTYDNVVAAPLHFWLLLFTTWYILLLSIGCGCCQMVVVVVVVKAHYQSRIISNSDQ